MQFFDDGGSWVCLGRPVPLQPQYCLSVASPPRILVEGVMVDGFVAPVPRPTARTEHLQLRVSLDAEPILCTVCHRRDGVPQIALPYSSQKPPPVASYCVAVFVLGRAVHTPKRRRNCPTHPTLTERLEVVAVAVLRIWVVGWECRVPAEESPGTELCLHDFEEID